jgi:site-specific recombinase XerD
MATFKAVILNGKAFKKSDGTTNIKIRITHKGKQDYVSTKYFVPVSTEKKSYFDSATGKAKGIPAAKFINDRISVLIASYIKSESALGDSADQMTVKQIKDHITKRKSDKYIDVIEFTENFISGLEKLKKDNTAQWHRSMLSALKNFVKNPKLNVLDVDSAFLNRFEQYMLKGDKTADPVRVPMTDGGVNNYMRSFRSIFNKMKDEYNDEETGIIRIAKNPWKIYKVKNPKRRQQGKNLTVDEMKKLVAYSSTNKSKQFARDMFLLHFCAIGINTKDLYFMPNPTGPRMEFDRFKTQRAYSIKIEPEMAEILKCYESDSRLVNIHIKYKDYRIYTRQIDVFLKKVAADLEIEKPISSNWARHTWATFARINCKIPKDDVALCMGHEDADNKVTDDYITYDYSIIDRSNRKVLNLIFKKSNVRK